MSVAPVCVFGEVLFDHFPDGQSILGGAPFNVAWHLQAFGELPLFISRVGNDADGHSVLQAMHDWGMNTNGMQTDNELPTGRVSVSIIDGEPEYDIVAPAAYDAITTPSSDCRCQLLYHGSLAVRDAGSRLALEHLRSDSPEMVFMDVNLRSPWWRRDRVQEMVQKADWIKLNSDELALLQADESDSLPGPADFLQRYELKGLVLTHGARGAELLTASGEQFRVQPGQDIKVVDTVGAGDAFASVIILGLVNNWPLDITLQRAQDFASSMVGNRGATVGSRDFYQSFVETWNLPR